MANTTRMQKKTVQRFMAYLEEMGLSIYGPLMDKSGNQYPSLMDYGAEEIVNRRKHVDACTLRRKEHM